MLFRVSENSCSLDNVFELLVCKQQTGSAKCYLDAMVNKNIHEISKVI